MTGITNVRGNKVKKILRKEQVNPGPYVAKVKSNNDPNSMGSLWVWIEDSGYIKETEAAGWYQVSYATPFYGVTSLEHNSKDNKFQSTQQSYGMFMVPPDIDTLVLVIFAGGMANKGYIIGCIPDSYMNHMVPGIAADEQWVAGDVNTTGFVQGEDLLPVAEFNKAREGGVNKNWQRNNKPVHKYQFEMLLEQGLIKDSTRGVTLSKSNRESPSSVYGISTPGRPLNNQLKDYVKDNLLEILTSTTPIKDKTIRPTNRKGGHSFVMDDGCLDGSNHLFRLRSSTGHQILLHDTEDLVYIGNAKGTAWVELSANGIDIFTSGKISMHSDSDINFHSDTAINMDAPVINQNSNSHNIATTAFTTGATSVDINTTTFNRTTSGNCILHYIGDKIEYIGKDTYSSHAAGTDFAGDGCPVRVGDIFGCVAPATASAGIGTLLTQKIAETGPTNASVLKWNDNGTISTIVSRVPQHEPWDRKDSV